MVNLVVPAKFWRGRLVYLQRKLQINSNMEKVISTERVADLLMQNGIRTTNVKAVAGPTFTLYKVYPEKGTKVREVQAVGSDIACALRVKSLRITTLRDCVGIEIARPEREFVPTRKLFESVEWKQAREKMSLPVAIGMRVDRRAAVIDLAKLPNLLIAGAAKQGKTVAMQSIAQSLAYSQARVIEIDPNGNALRALTELVDEMDRRIADKAVQPPIVVLIDEYSDIIVDRLKEARDALSALIRLAANGQEAGIHMIVSTQRVDRHAISGLVKANFPARLALRTASAEESKIIIDVAGAEQLTGSGDALLLSAGTLTRLQVGFAED